jgi:hypothetical protein
VLLLGEYMKSKSKWMDIHGTMYDVPFYSGDQIMRDGNYIYADNSVGTQRKDSTVYNILTNKTIISQLAQSAYGFPLKVKIHNNNLYLIHGNDNKYNPTNGCEEDFIRIVYNLETSEKLFSGYLRYWDSDYIVILNHGIGPNGYPANWYAEILDANTYKVLFSVKLEHKFSSNNCSIYPVTRLGKYIYLFDTLYEIIPKEKRECAICFNKAKPVGLIAPCLHKDFCFNCVKDIKECPMCRGPVSSVVQI